HAAKIEHQAVVLQQQSIFQSQVSLAIGKLKVDIDRRFLQIYNSRIWRTLVAGGGFLERLPGLRRRAPEPPSAVDGKGAGASMLKPPTIRSSSAVQQSDSPPGIDSASLQLKYSLGDQVDGQECRPS